MNEVMHKGRNNYGDTCVRIETVGIGAHAKSVLDKIEADASHSWLINGTSGDFTGIKTEDGKHQGITYRYLYAAPKAPVPQKTFHKRPDQKLASAGDSL